MTLVVTDVFTPGSFPEHTYVQRKSVGLEEALRISLTIKGQIISLSGPSKSGKTVLIEKVIGKENLITVTGGGIRKAEDIWDRVLDSLGVPHTASSSNSSGTTSSVGGGIKSRAGVPGVLMGEGHVETALSKDRTHDESHIHERSGMAQVIDHIGGTGRVILIDDFHYISRDIQVDVAEMIKEAVHQEVKICTAAVPHRGDDVLRANSDLRGRVRTIDLNYWNKTELMQIARIGFEALNVTIPNSYVEIFASESAGSPQLMQLICLNACILSGIEKSAAKKQIAQDPQKMRQILEVTTGHTDCRTLVDILETGPKKRGKPRTNFAFRDGTGGDVYVATLKAIIENPPVLSFPYEELKKRVAKVCFKEPPTGSSIVEACEQMSALAKERFPEERAIDWDEQKQILDVADPYLLFYLRCSKRLKPQ